MSKIISMLSTHPFCGALLALALSFNAFAGPGIWTSSGPEGGRVNGLIASPNAVNTFYAVSNGGVFKTVDGGVNWFEANAGINRQLTGSILHSQTAADTLYVFGSRFVYFSNDGASTWQDRSPLPGVIVDAFISNITLSPVFPGRLYMGLSNGNMLRSDNAGLTWMMLPALPGTDFSVTSLAAHPTVPNTLLASTSENVFGSGDTRLFRSMNAGLSWTEIPCPMNCPWQDSGFRDMHFAGVAGKMWAVNFSGVARSLDFGQTWTTIGTFPTRAGQYIISNPSNNNEVFVGGRQGLGFTLDDGVTWTDVLSGFTGNSALLPTDSTQVAYDPFNPAIQLAGSGSNGVYRRISPAAIAWAPSVNGFNATSIRAVDITTGNRVHAGIGESGTFSGSFSNFRSTNNGLTWNQTNTGLNADFLRDLSVDPNATNVVYGGGRYVVKFDDMGMILPPNGGIYKSIDNGITWSTIDNGIPLPAGASFSPFGTVRSIAIDVLSNGGSGPSQTLYAGGSGRFSEVDDGMGGTMIVQDAARIYKSTNAGTTWVPMENGLGTTETGMSGRLLFASAVQVILDPTDTTGNTLYAATFIGGLQDTDAPTIIQNGVFKTIDGGANWVHMSNGLPKINGNPATTEANILSLAIDPNDATGQTLYASSNDFANSFAGSVYKTTDGGANWFFSSTGLTNRDVRDITVDPATGDIYAAAADPLSNGDGGVFVSTDGGLNWSSISVGFPESAVALKLALDNTGSNLLIQAGTTRGIQTFEVLPDDEMDGATNMQEEQAPNGGDGNQDGMADSSQAFVASPTINDATRGTQSTITASVTPILGNCDRLENSFGLDLLQSIPNEITYDLLFNGLHLRIPDCQQAEVELIYHAGDFTDQAWQMRAYGIAFPDEDRNSWSRLPATNTANTWTFELIDGDIGDNTPADNIIVFQGAAAILTEEFFSDGMEVE